MDIDPAAFQKEVEELVDLYNKVYGRQQEVVQELKDVRNERHGLENEMVVLQRAIRELDADYALAEDPATPDPVECPTCGTEIANSIVERFGILDDIDYCYSLIDQRKKKLVDVVSQEKQIQDRYKGICSELSPIEDLLQRKREKITFAEFVAAEGMKDVVGSLTEDINSLLLQENDIRSNLAKLESDLKLDSKRKKEINEYYQARMKEFLGNLSVNVLSETDYKTFEKQIKSNALGSDLPRSLLAQHFAFLQTMKRFNTVYDLPSCD